MSLDVDLNDLHRMESRASSLSDDTVPPEGTAVLAVDRFGFSALNVGYADAGSSLGYWSMFPAPDGTGTIPVWGHATVLRSSHPDLAPGRTYYGLLPMATHLLVSPEAVGPRGFTDASPHRRRAAPVYNRYLDRSSDPLSTTSPSAASEVLLRPTFTTSFLLDADLAEQGWSGADALILTSASSRTAIGTAQVMRTRSQRPAIVGLTSARHMTDVRLLGCYDRVVDYDDIGSLPVGPTALVDLSGDPAVVAGIHHRLGEALVHSSAVGATHRLAPPLETSTLPGARRSLFLAPGVATRLRERLGVASVERTLAAAWRICAHEMQDWFEVREAQDATTVQQVYRQVLEGTVAPRHGWVLSLRPGTT
ncbi:MAG: DUF2855 family protein [Actinobacteria bacterium]|nr:DUF2855 family protein [Actinomycetota bacterium]